MKKMRKMQSEFKKNKMKKCPFVAIVFKNIPLQCDEMLETSRGSRQLNVNSAETPTRCFKQT